MSALLGLGALTLLSVQTELSSTGQSRFNQSALYAAESGVAAGMDFLRNNCTAGAQMFTPWMSPSNSAPQKPPQIVGNGLKPGVSGNPFSPGSDVWYEVTLLNDIEDQGFAAGQDWNGTAILHVVGHGPDQTVATLEVEVQNQNCLATFCEQEYAQRNVTARNDANAACSARVTSGQLRTMTPGN
ncbi:MAG TPA: hypothetical protein VKE22_01540 [Haliangiales bacterium]|nr:hypothetical protein [Haliangiales bacterium]